MQTFLKVTTVVINDIITLDAIIVSLIFSPFCWTIILIHVYLPSLLQFMHWIIASIHHYLEGSKLVKLQEINFQFLKQEISTSLIISVLFVINRLIAIIFLCNAPLPIPTYIKKHSNRMSATNSILILSQVICEGCRIQWFNQLHTLIRINTISYNEMISSMQPNWTNTQLR